MESAENQAQPISPQGSLPDSPPLSKTETIALLNDSIDRLEETIKRISENSAQVPSSQSIETLLTTTQELEAAVSSTEEKVTKSTPAAREDQAQTVPPTPSVATRVNQKLENPKNTAPKTDTPSKPKNRRLLIIIGALAIATVLGLWFWQPPQLVRLLPQAKTSTEIVEPELPEQLTTPETPLGEVTDGDNIANISPDFPDFPSEIKSVGKPEADVVETIIPEELVSPGKAKNLKIVAIKPKLNFSPEQNLLAALDTKLSELVLADPNEVIAQIRPNLDENKLLVEVTDSWYSLDESEQDSLGQEILQRARAFSFDKLELKDNAGTLVARNPVVGGHIIVLQNNQENSPE